MGQNNTEYLRKPARKTEIDAQLVLFLDVIQTFVSETRYMMTICEHVNFLIYF